MSGEKEEILIVDDSPPIRTSLSLVLREMGYRVRAAEDGFAALRAVRQGLPDILLSDLNMPGMSGFELLAVFRQRFPEIKLIAMSGAFSHGAAPPNLSADAFYQKGQGIDALMQVIEKLAGVERGAPRGSGNASPISVDGGTQDHFKRNQGTLSCPVCLRTFTQPVEDTDDRLNETRCIHCESTIQWSMARGVCQAESREDRYEGGSFASLRNASALCY